MVQLRTFSVLFVLSLVTVSAPAATYLVPNDSDLVTNAEGIVIATAIETHSELVDGSRIVTVTQFKIENVLKSSLQEGGILRLVQPGGIFGNRITMIGGTPSYQSGRRYLVFLHKYYDGWTTYGLGLGQFEFATDVRGRELVLRTQWQSLNAFDPPDWTPHVEQFRDAQQFLQFIRAVVNHRNAPVRAQYFVDPSQTVREPFPEFRPRVNTVRLVPNFIRGSYLMSGNGRWQNGGVAGWVYCCTTTPPGAGTSGTSGSGMDGVTGIDAAFSNWNGAGTSVNFTNNGLDNSAFAGLAGFGHGSSDGKHTILLNDPYDDIRTVFGSATGTVAVGGYSAATGTYTLSGEATTFVNIIEGDVIGGRFSNLVGVNQATYNGVMTHEVGHALGFRHSDQAADNSSACDPGTMDCAPVGAAIMAHIIGNGMQTLQPWDQRAIQTVYGSGVTCDVPSGVSVSPSAATINAGDSVTLTATVGAGTAPFTYAWTRDGAALSGTGSSITDAPAAGTHTYQVSVSNACGGPVTASTSVTVNAGSCTPPSGVAAVASATTINSGQSVTLTATVADGTQPFNFTWTANGGFAGNTREITVFPGSDTRYQVTVSNACSSGVTSNIVSVTVIGAPQCTPPSNVNLTASTSSVTAGQSVTLTATVAGGTQPFSYQWFSGNTAIAGTGPSITISPTATATYHVIVSNACNSGVDSNAVTVAVGSPCSTSISSVSANPNPVFAGQSFTLTANASTTSGTLSYRWFRGALGDTSQQVGSTQSITMTETATTNFWVSVTSSCGGSAQTGQVTVNLNTGTCGTNPNQLCISNTRYRVTLSAHDPNGKTGQGVANYQSDVFGYFSLPDFSTPTDPQVFVKILGPVDFGNGPTTLVFYSGLTNLDYTLTVIDTTTGQPFKSYRVPPPTDATKSVGDFDVFGGTSTLCSNVTVSSGQTSAGGACPSSGGLCLLNRFNVTLLAKDNPSRSNNQGAGSPVPVNDVFGFFSTPTLSPNPTDIQGFIKMINGSVFNGHFWVFLGGLTDFDLTFTVTDTQNGLQKIYHKPAVSTCGLNDTEAF